MRNNQPPKEKCTPWSVSQWVKMLQRFIGKWTTKTQWVWKIHNKNKMQLRICDYILCIMHTYVHIYMYMCMHETSTVDTYLYALCAFLCLQHPNSGSPKKITWLFKMWPGKTGKGNMFVEQWIWNLQYQMPKPWT